MSDQPSASDWDWTTFGIGILGWAIPTVLAMPLAWGHESSGGEAALWAAIVGSSLAAVGCLVAGAVVGIRVGRSGRAGARDAFGIGLAGVAMSGFAILVLSVAIETFVRVVHLGLVGFLLLIPLTVAYSVGFVFGRMV